MKNGHTLDLFLLGAYGREANEADWLAGKDFKILNGPYCSISDMEEIRLDGYDYVTLLNNKRQAIMTIPVNPKP